jgi:hypothetical protein
VALEGARLKDKIVILMLMLIDHLESARLMVVQSTILGFPITESPVANMAADVEEKMNNLDPSKSIIVVKLLDNS